MPLSIDSALGIHQHSLQLYARRAEVLAANLANADTPGYLARDLDFQAALDAAGQQSRGLALQVSHPAHLPSSGAGGTEAEVLFRNPLQPSVDGNTVDSQMEKSEFAGNALRYMASLTFLNGRITGLLSTLRSE